LEEELECNKVKEDFLGYKKSSDSLIKKQKVSDKAGKSIQSLLQKWSISDPSSKNLPNEDKSTGIDSQIS